MVQAADIVPEFDSRIAELIEQPQRLLLPAAHRPHVLPRPLKRLARTYGDYVLRNVKAGLQVLKPMKIFRHGGAPLLNVCFAGPKSDLEDRAITALCPTNELVDRAQLWKPVFGRPSALRTLLLPRGHRLRLYKRDCRHFFHVLKVHRRWEKYFAHAPLAPNARGAVLVPCHRAFPMGFRASASWAQALNEALVRRAGLPSQR